MQPDFTGKPLQAIQWIIANPGQWPSALWSLVPIAGLLVTAGLAFGWEYLPLTFFAAEVFGHGWRKRGS